MMDIGPAYKAITAVHALTDTIDTAVLFQKGPDAEELSPIDEFIENTNKINTIYLEYLPGNKPLPPELGALVVLGYMSAVESYMRALVRGLINIDEYSARLAESRMVSFGAALHHQRALLPEALLEDASLAGPENVLRTLKDFIGIRGKPPGDVRQVLSEFRKICEIRHCCVHRFAKLGAKNAIALGMQAHKMMLEKPLNTSVQDLQTIAAVLRLFAKTINNYVFQAILERSARNKDDEGIERLYSLDWKWDYRSDRGRFIRYYDLFATTRDVQVSVGAKKVYDSFRAAYAGAQSRGRG